MTTRSIANFWDGVYADFDPSAMVNGDLELPPNVPPIQDKSMMIVACGTGEHVVRACRTGAKVLALDISPKAVENARQMVNHAGLSADYIVADAGDTKLPDGSLDLIWGSAVLHHLSHEHAAAEFGRILKPGGRVYMISEPTFFNPLLKFTYETMFGKGREGRRRRFLFFRRRGDDFEKPIEESDLTSWRKRFDVTLIPRPLMFAEKIGHVTSRNAAVHKRFAAIDRLIERVFPNARKYSYDYDFIFIKR